MTTPVSNARPVATPVAKPAATTAAQPATEPTARRAGDTIALSATAKATAPQKVVVIDGKEYEVREKKHKWPLWEKITTFGATGVGGVAGVFVGAFCAIGVDFSGALTPASLAAWAVGFLICTAIGYGTGRLASKGANGVAGWFK